ncbi:MAG: transcriptional regulator [Devosia sp.]|nr:transcriptional regulator [Devosia sp.]
MSELAETNLGASLLEQVTLIVSAFVSNNAISPADLPKLISETYGSLQSLSAAEISPVVEDLKPAVPVRKSVTPDFIICLDDGLKFKSMKRHLAKLGMTPIDYRAKWGLPSDYPMVAPNYTATRSALAKTNGLGRKPTLASAAPEKRTKKPKMNA